ncbi:hypothetical protein ACER0C_002123 [Sarotherodon galilaeus]
MHILVLILGTVLLPKACALKCYKCIPGPSGNCTQTTKECPSNTQCISFRTSTYAGGSKHLDIKGKDCAVAEDCSEGSINFGVLQILITSKCCTSDLCNTQDAPDGNISPSNGKKCFQCDANNCTKTLTCNGNEDYCISGAEEKITVKGCASKLMCSSTQTAQISEIIGEEFSCCQGDLCNSAGTGTTASLLLFMAPLIYLVLFS